MNIIFEDTLTIRSLKKNHNEKPNLRIEISTNCKFIKRNDINL